MRFMNALKFLCRLRPCWGFCLFVLQVETSMVNTETHMLRTDAPFRLDKIGLLSAWTIYWGGGGEHDYALHVR